MRVIMSLLSKYRSEQIKRQYAKAPPAQLNKRLAEAQDMFNWADRDMSGIKPTDTNTRLQEVMVSGDFTYAIQEFIQRQTVPGYTQQRFEFEPLVKMETVPNYMLVTRYQDRESTDDMEYVGEKGAPRPGYRSDGTKRRFRVYRFEKQWDFSHELLVNDDLGYFQDHARKMGRSARRTLEKYVSRFYTNATSLARLSALGALFDTTGRLTTARISTARMAFGQRVDGRTESIEADLKYIVYHRGLEDVVATIQASQLVPENATNAANIVRGRFVAIKDPYITGTAPDLPWYAFTDWKDSNVIPFVLARRQGMNAPMILRKKTDIESVTSMLGGGGAVPAIMGDFHTRNIQVMVIDAWGTYIDGIEGNYFDTNGGYQSSGTAP